LRKRLHRDAVDYFPDPTTVTQAGAAGGRERGLWDVFLVIALIIGLFEPLLANLISVRLYGRVRVTGNVAMPLPSAAAPAAPTPVSVAAEGPTR